MTQPTYETKYICSCCGNIELINPSKTGFRIIEELCLKCKNEKNIQEVIKISFIESLSDSSLNLIQRILKESLGYETKIERLPL